MCVFFSVVPKAFLLRKGKPGFIFSDDVCSLLSSPIFPTQSHARTHARTTEPALVCATVLAEHDGVRTVVVPLLRRVLDARGDPCDGVVDAVFGVLRVGRGRGWLVSSHRSLARSCVARNH